MSLTWSGGKTACVNWCALTTGDNTLEHNKHYLAVFEKYVNVIWKAFHPVMQHQGILQPTVSAHTQVCVSECVPQRGGDFPDCQIA